VYYITINFAVTDVLLLTLIQYLLILLTVWNCKKSKNYCVTNILLLFYI